MHATFLATVNVEGDTDLVGISKDISDALEDKGFTVLLVHPWQRTTLQAPLQTPPVAPANTN